jgi:segregation and condensation protein A
LEATALKESQFAKTSSVSSANSGNFYISLNFFEGPMDLLLHLVKQQEVSIEEVDMSDIAEQYLKIVSHQAEKLDLDRATEYLVIAATLLAVKSQSLLPAEAEYFDDEFLLSEDSEIYNDLRERLRNYELTKLQAIEIRHRPVLGLDTFGVGGNKHQEQVVEDQEILAEEPSYLAEVLIKLFRRIGTGVNNMRIQLEPISLVSFMMKIIDRVQTGIEKTLGKGSISFTGLVSGFVSGFGRNKKSHHKTAIIGSFAAVLELVRRGLISVEQESDHAEIQISSKMDDADTTAKAIAELESQAKSGSINMESVFSDNSDSSKVIKLDDYRDESREESEPEKIIVND